MHKFYKMKNILIFIVFISTITTANSQSLIPTKVGLKIGLYSSNLYLQPIEGIKPVKSAMQTGITGGLCISIPLSDKWYINTDILYTQKGSSFDYFYTYDYTVNQRIELKIINKLNLAYIDLNPMFSVKTSNNTALNFGPFVSYLISDDYTFEAELISDTPTMVGEGIFEPFYEGSDIDAGINLGISHFVTDHLLFDSKLSVGLLNSGTINKPYLINNDSSGNQIIPEADFSTNSLGFSFLLTYLF